MKNMQVNSITHLACKMEQLCVSVPVQDARGTSEHVRLKFCPHRDYMLVNETLIGN